MNTLNHPPGEERLAALLHESRPAPALPPRFNENVWRRIGKADRQTIAPTWIEALASLLLKPRFAFAIVVVVLLAGTVLGSLNGYARARLAAQERYVTAVAMTVGP